MFANGLIRCGDFTFQQARQLGNAVVELATRFGNQDHRIPRAKEILVTEPVLTNGHAPAVHVSHLSDGCFGQDEVGTLDQDQQVGFKVGLRTMPGAGAQTHLAEHLQGQCWVTNSFLQMPFK